MTILITGASGFLGQNLIKRYPNSIKTYFNNKIDGGTYCDLRNIDEVKSLFNNHHINFVVHLAANPAPRHPTNVKTFLEDHILTTTNLLECSQNISFVYISSILVYGDNYPNEYPSNLYGACKLSCEKICEAYADLNDLKMSIIRPCAIVGKGLTHGLLFDIQRKLKLDNEFLELFGDEPGTIKPFVNVEDVIRYIDFSLIRPDGFLQIFTCFPDDNLSVKGVAEAVMNKTGIIKPIKWLGDKTIWKGDNRIISTKNVHNTIQLKYPTSLEAIQYAI